MTSFLVLTSLCVPPKSSTSSLWWSTLFPNDDDTRSDYHRSRDSSPAWMVYAYEVHGRRRHNETDKDDGDEDDDGTNKNHVERSDSSHATKDFIVVTNPHDVTTNDRNVNIEKHLINGERQRHDQDEPNDKQQSTQHVTTTMNDDDEYEDQTATCHDSSTHGEETVKETKDTITENYQASAEDDDRGPHVGSHSDVDDTDRRRHDILLSSTSGGINVDILLDPAYLISERLVTQDDTLIDVSSETILGRSIPVYHFQQPARISTHQYTFQLVLVRELSAVGRSSIQVVPVNDLKKSQDSWFPGYSWNPLVMTMTMISTTTNGLDPDNDANQGSVMQRHVGWKFTATKPRDSAFIRNMTAPSSSHNQPTSESESTSSSTIPHFYALMIERTHHDSESGNGDYGNNSTNTSIADEIQEFIRVGGMKVPGWMMALAAPNAAVDR